MRKSDSIFGYGEFKMKNTVLLDEEKLIEKAILILNENLGPVETARFLNLKKNTKRIDSVKRHREWQKTLNEETFLNRVFK